MTQAQKIAKDKFKKAIEYRTKTGVSLKEAFAHIYGKKDAVKKKDAPKKKAATKKVASKKSILNGIKQKFIFDIYKRNQYGDSIPSSKKSVSIVRLNSFTAKDFLYKKYPSSKYFIELESSEKIGAIKIIEKGENKNTKAKATYQQVRTKKGTYKGLKKVGNINVISGLKKIVGIPHKAKYYISYTTENGIKKVEYFEKLPIGRYKGMDRVIYLTRLTNSGTSLIPVKLTSTDKELKK